MATKRKAIVKVSRVQGINKNTYVGDAIVSEDMFPEGNFDLLIGSGHLEEIQSKVPSNFQKKEPEKKAEKELEKDKKK